MSEKPIIYEVRAWDRALTPEEIASMPNDNKCPRCKNTLDAEQAVVQGHCRVCGWDLSVPDAAAKEKRPADPRRYQGPGRKK